MGDRLVLERGIYVVVELIFMLGRSASGKKKRGAARTEQTKSTSRTQT